MQNNQQILIEPWITEAATVAQEMGKYVFKVSPDSNKQQIRKAVEEAYKVKVTAVNTVNIPKKMRNYGRTPGWKAGFKKAVVTLKKGESISFFENK